MFALFKSKVKVYFYHLFILALVMLCCFFLMYKDIKRIEGNVLNLRSKCNQLEQKCLENDSSNLLDKDYVMLDNEDIDLTEDEVNEINEDSVEEEEDVDNVSEQVLENNVEEQVVEEVTNDNEVVENNEKKHVDQSEGDIDNLLKEVTLSNEDDNNIDILLNEVEKIKSTEDFSKLSESELSDKTNNELKEYLRSVGKSTSGNKKELIQTILN